MAHRIEITNREGIRDPLAEKVKRRIERDLGRRVETVRTVEVYVIDASLTKAQLQELARAYSDPITQRYTIDEPIARDFDWVIEVGFLPGVTDNVGRTARETLLQVLRIPLREEEKVYTSRQYLIKGKLDREEARRIATEVLGNPLINRFEIRSKEEWDPKVGIGPIVPKVGGSSGGRVQEISLEVSDEELERISRERLLALSLKEMRAIQRYLRDPEVVASRIKVGLGDRVTDVELEAIAQTWSEHCKHKIFNAFIRYVDEEAGAEERITSLFDTYIRRSTEEIRRRWGERDICLSVFVDNAGVVAFNDRWSLTFKVETHNTPSALDPYGGALTGIVGVNRDPFGTGKGAKLIFNTDVFCFAPPHWEG
ncbi:MAG: phosphoribosylformylglycinamidine synthase, partial [Deltaproteobacteria bacterium]